MNKKATVEVQFNWIYATIVGFTFLIIFFGVGMAIRSNAQKSMERDVAVYLDDIFTSMQGSENTENSLDLPSIDIAFKDDCQTFNVGSQAESIKYLPVFSPSLVKKKLVSFSLGWDIPFRANYLLYVTSKEVAYVLVGISEDLGLPDNINKEKVASLSAFVNQNNYKVRLIFFEDPLSQSLPPSVKKMMDTDVTAIQIVKAENKVNYFRKKGNSLVSAGTVYYADIPTMVAAIYSENPKIYECNMEKAMTRLNLESEALLDRISIITESDIPDCIPLLNQARGKLSEIEVESRDTRLTSEKVTALHNIRMSLNNLNGELNIKSCPTVY
ncbi:MAG: hypothetical protein HGA85_00465 [Nanoarchaeota archaeon]|nr:hypothetical protein [Nanoarchaeota archaeon]